MAYGGSKANATEMGIRFQAVSQVGPFVSGYLKSGVMVRVEKTYPYGTLITIHLALPGRKRSATTQALAQGAVAGQQTIVVAHLSEREQRAMVSLVAVAESTPTDEKGNPTQLLALMDMETFEEEEALVVDRPPPRPKPRRETAAAVEQDLEIQLDEVEIPDHIAEPEADSLTMERGLATLVLETSGLYVRTLTELRGEGARVQLAPVVPEGYEFFVMLPRLGELSSIVVPVLGGEVTETGQLIRLATLTESVQTKLYQLMVDAFRLPGVTDPIPPNTVVVAEWEALPKLLEAEAGPEPVSEPVAPAQIVPTTGDPSDKPVDVIADETVGVDTEVPDPAVDDDVSTADEAGEYIVREIFGTYTPMPSMSSLRFTPSWSRLEDVPTAGLWLVHFLGYLCRRPFTGMLQFSYGSNVIEFILVEGVVENVHTTDGHFQNLLGGTLLANKVLRVQQLQKAISLAQSDKIRLDKALFTLNLVSPGDLVRGLRQTQHRLLDEALEAGDGSFRCQEWTHSPYPAGPVQVPFVSLVSHCLKAFLVQLEAADVEERLERLMARYPFVPDECAETVNNLALSQKERHVVDNVLNGCMVLRKAYASSALNDTLLTRLIVRIGLMGLLKFPATQQRHAAGESPEEFLSGALEMLVEQNYFDRLKVHWTEHGLGIDASYKELSEAYGPEMQAQLNTMKEAELAQQVWDFIDEAYRHICRPDGRHRVRAELFDKEAINRAAEILFQQGEMAAFRGDRTEARNVFERAFDLNPLPKYTDAIATHCGPYDDLLPKADKKLTP